MGIAKKIRRKVGQAARSALGRGTRDRLGLRLRQSSALFDPDWYRRTHGIAVASAADVLEHYRASGWRQGLDPNPLFDTLWYRVRHRRLLKHYDLDPLTHFIERGRELDCRPNPFFDAKRYAEQVPAAEMGQLGPFAHYLEKGAKAHLAVDQFFDSRWYRATHMTGAEGNWPALAHYLRIGAYQGLAPGPGVAGPDELLATPAHRREVQLLYTRMIASTGPAAIDAPGYALPNALDGKATGRIAIYTAIIGDYDTLKLPYPEWSERADFFCFTDRRFKEQGAWRLIRPDYHNIDPTRIARFYKTHPHVFLRNYDSAIWIDGNIALRMDPRELVDELDPVPDVISYRHPSRRTIAEEARECIARAKDEAEAMRAQLKRYSDLGYVQKSPLIETNVMILRPSRPLVGRCLDRWWGEIERGTKRDQLSINYSIDSIAGISIGFLPEKSVRESPRFLYVKHG